MWGVVARGGGRGVVCREGAGLAQNLSALWADDLIERWGVRDLS